ncbi:hypothetical protein BJ912DRAFT_1036697 [Pholiota molesta]|nr:hypothetical protein BJ912DRAFT_1036697 [Pholiota molesta]
MAHERTRCIVPASARTALSHARVRAILPYVRVHAATQRIFTAMALALAWDNAVRKRSSGYSLDQCRASNPVNTHWNDSAQAIQWIFTGSVPREQSSECSLDRCRPVDIYLPGPLARYYASYFMHMSCERMRRIVGRQRTRRVAPRTRAPFQWISTGSLARHRSSEYPLDRSRGTDPVNIHWIAHGAPFQWISTGFFAPVHATARAALSHARGRHSSGHSLDHSRGIDPVNIHCIARAAPLQWISTGFFTRLMYLDCISIQLEAGAAQNVPMRGELHVTMFLALLCEMYRASLGEMYRGGGGVFYREEVDEGESGTLGGAVSIMNSLAVENGGTLCTFRNLRKCPGPGMFGCRADHVQASTVAKQLQIMAHIVRLLEL